MPSHMRGGGTHYIANGKLSSRSAETFCDQLRKHHSLQLARRKLAKKWCGREPDCISHYGGHVAHDAHARPRALAVI